MNWKTIFTVPAFVIGLLFTTTLDAQTCCSAKKSGLSSTNTETSGCAPSNCRGAKTKFGEAKVITDLRSELGALKASMEQSQSPSFSERSYDVHDIVGESDEESISIIVREVELIEKEMAEKLGQSFAPLEIPETKAKQIGYLKKRIGVLRGLLG